MKKALIASAVAVAIAAPFAASADVTIYGKSRLTVSKNDSSVAGVDNWQVGDATPRIGFKGSEDLGGGLKAIFKLESAYGTDAGTALSAARNSYVGLSGSWGTFLGGRHDTPYKMSFYASGIDIGDSIGQTDMHTNATGVGPAFQDEVRTNNALAYVSPNFNGLTLAVATVAGENTTADGRDGLADSYSLGAMYKGGAFKVGAGYESIGATAGTNDENRWHISGSVAFGNAQIGLSYNDTENDGGNNMDRDTLALSGQMKFGGSNRVGLVYAKAESNNNAAWGTNMGENDKLGLFFEHKMSKRTKVFAAWAKHDFDAAAAGGGTNTDETDLTFGLYHDF